MQNTLDAIADVVMGQSPKGDSCNHLGIGTPLLNGPTEFGFHHPQPVQYTTAPKKYAEQGDLLFCVRGSTTGRMNWADQKYAIGRGIAAIRHVAGSEYQWYLRAVLEYRLPELLAHSTGSTFPNISRDQLLSLEIPLPPLPVQKKIAAILSSLDDKIEINTRMNKVLEETARPLFHRWFVEFEFPNDEGKPYKSSGGRMIASEMGEIPEGWSVVELREIVDVHSGYSYKGSELHESQTALATIKNFDRNGGFKLNGFKEIVPSKKVKSEQYVRLHDIIVAHTDLTQNADVIGNCELLVSTAKYDNIIISMDLVKVVPKKTEINNYFVMSILSNVKFKQHSLGYINGTTVLHLSKSAIPDYKIPLPENMLICMVFGTILENIYTLITKNINENQVILEIRDSLIPKLMNGKVKVI